MTKIFYIYVRLIGGIIYENQFGSFKGRKVFI